MPTTAAQHEIRSDAGAVEQQLLALIRDLLLELGSRQAAQNVSLHALLDRDLGLGSLERVELLVRVEDRFRCRLSDEIAQQAETAAQWVQAIVAGAESAGSEPRYEIKQPLREAPPPPQSATSFVEVLRGHAEALSERVQIHLLEEHSGQDITYGQLLARSAEVAAGLAAAGLKRNETVAIMLPTGADFFYAFLGVTLAGGIAVPIYPPARANQIEEYVRRQLQILRNAEVRFLISFDQVRSVSKVMRLGLPSLIDVTTVETLAESALGAHPPEVSPAEAFFIQYTSGSTGNPKGVVLSHANVLANVRGIGWAVQARPADIVVSWLPLYHDMGLIGSWLFSVYHAFPITIMSPLAFLSRPERWLWALSDSGGTLCPAPNFSYELCARKTPDQALEGVDLSAWRVAINAGEPVLPETLRRFARRFEPYGFRPESYIPCYGLAESSVALTFPPLNRRPLIDRIRRDIFEREGRAAPAEPGDTRVLEFVANGTPLPEHEIRIVDDHHQDVPERVQGRLLFRGPSRTSGYYRNPEATRAVIDDQGWMDSGDLAYWANGEIYITGRKKDAIIKGGHNVIPQDVEAAAAEVPGVRRGCVAAFGTVDEETGTERLVVVAETRTSDPAELTRIEAEIIQHVAAQVGMPPDRVELVPSQTVPKTSSGKIRRHETRSLYESGSLRGKAHPPWLQVARLWLAHLGPWAKHTARTAGVRARRGYGRTVTFVLGIGCGLLIRLLPSRHLSARVVSGASRLLLRLHGVHLDANESTPEDARPRVFLANREGGLDPVAVVAALSTPLLLADAQNLRSLPNELAFLFEPLVIPSVEQETAPSGGTLDQRVRQALVAGYSVLVFAEGPLGTPPARSRFRLEPIQAAVETSNRLHPICVSGTASLPPSLNGIKPQVAVALGPALAPGGGDPRELAGLRERVRSAIAELARVP